MSDNGSQLGVGFLLVLGGFGLFAALGPILRGVMSIFGVSS